MAKAKCPHCQSTSFDGETSSASTLPIILVKCAQCGAVVGAVNNVRAAPIKDALEKISRLH
jgi:endogenous inhibitor of DNA gyrase (YacG/DUF329 family)